MTHPRELERQYQAARFAEYSDVSRNVAVAGALLTLGLWLRDYADDPFGARATLAWRLLMASGVALYAFSLMVSARRWIKLAAGYVAVLTVEFVVLEIWTRLSGGYRAGFPGYMYIYLIAPMVLLPFSLRESLGVLLMVPLVPNAQVALGMAPGFPLLAFNALIWPACGIAVFAQREFDQLFRKLFLSQRQLSELATRDALTGLGNRRDFMARAEAACGLARRHRRELCVLMLDIDHFKAVNDRHGHAAGDDVLRLVSETFALALRNADICGRIGGEEFAAVLPETGPKQAMQTAERVRQAIADKALPTVHAPEPLRVTVSVGVAALSHSESLDELLARADKNLYEAKRTGRNRIVGVRIAENSDDRRIRGLAARPRGARALDRDQTRAPLPALAALLSGSPDR